MRVDLLVEALPIMGTGYLGIFVVPGVILGVVTMLKKLTGNGFHSHCFTIIQSVIGKYVMFRIIHPSIVSAMNNDFFCAIVFGQLYCLPVTLCCQ